MNKMKKGLLGLSVAALGTLALAACDNDGVNDTSTNGDVLYAAPEGKTGATGSINDPLDVSSAMLSLKAGQTLILKEGTYKLSERIYIPENQDGKANAYIKVLAEEGKKVVLDFSEQIISSTNRGIQINADYWYFYGLEIMGAGDNGMYVAGSYNVVENCSFHENQDTGLQIGRADSMKTNVKDWPHNNLIKNCTSYNNYDYLSYGENADGFAAKLTVGEANVFDGCIAYRNSDDGWDLYAKTDSGNVGTVIIKNCLSFENGWLLQSTAAPDDTDLDSNGVSKITTTAKVLAKTNNKSYTTRDGDGIGFKLGGSTMEGNVIVENSIAFNNRLHGISDNSNPGVLSLRNCTTFNNSVTPNSQTGEVGPSNVDNKSNNFDTARTENSYNNYYGLLSYTTNQTQVGVTYSNSDAFRGSVGYSIFCLGKNKYTSFTDYKDASSYETDKIGTAYNRMNDSMFESVKFPYQVNGNREIHKNLRNSDGSINLGKMLNVVDQELLTYCEGNQIGAKLNYNSWEEYDHYKFTDFTNTTLTETEINLQQAIDALTIMCNANAVYQNINLLTTVNGFKVSWSSSNEAVVEIGEDEYKSVSGVTYVKGILNRDRASDKKVTLTATIESNGKKVTKNFEFNIKKDIPRIGGIIGFENRYILTQFQDYELPTISVLNGAYYSNKELIEGVDYKARVEIQYAQSSADFDNNNYSEISKVYTSLPGVYKVIYTIESLLDDGKVYDTYFYAYVVSENADIDMAKDENKEPLYEVNVSRDGVLVSANFTNILGDMYVYATKDDVTDANIVMEKGQKYAITDQSLQAVYNMPNDDVYNVYIVVTNKKGSSISEVYKKSILVEEINNREDFYNLVTNPTDSTTIYLLTADIDFKDFEWKSGSQNFSGLLNGNGYTIKNLTISNQEKKHSSIFYRLENGTIMNINFENITISGKAGTESLAGIVGQMNGGYLHNIGLKNIAVSSYTGAGALVGQVTGGVNYISQVSLVLDKDYVIRVENKYAGGIVGNMQKDTTEDKVELYVSDCYVKGVIGDGKDGGGYIGGIIGRNKNEFESYKLDIQRCYFEGQVMTGKNYAAGIFAGSDNGAGSINIMYCAANCTIYFAGTILDGLSDATMAAKNCSPIYGRYTVGVGRVNAMFNYAGFADTQIATDTELFYENIKRESFWSVTLGMDTENVWIFDATNQTISLRTPSTK